MKTLKLLVAATAAVMMTFAAEAAKTAKAVLTDDGATLKFVYDSRDYGAEGKVWFFISSDGGSWEDCGSTVTKVVFDSSFKSRRPTSTTPRATR